MAELGSIQYTDLERGAVRPSSGRELAQGIGQALDVIDKMVVDDVLGDFREASEEVITDAREGATTVQGPDRDLGSDLPGQQGALQRRARTLQAQIEQGNSSQRGLAELELKRLLNRTQAEHPALATHLREQFGQIVTASSRLDEIGLVDAINKQNSAAAEAELKDMMDFAYRKTEEGGLGINPSIRPHEAEFARQYTQKSQMRDMIETNTLKVQFAASVADMNVREKATIYEQAATGQGNLVNASIDRYFPVIMQYRNEMAKPIEQRNGQFLQDFQDVTKNAIIQEMNFLKQSSMQVLSAMYSSPQERATEAYAMNKAVFDDIDAQIDLFIEAVNSEEPAFMDSVIASYQIRNTNMRRQNQSLDNWMVMFDPRSEGIKDMMTFLNSADLTGSAVIQGQQIAREGIAAVYETLGLNNSTEALAEVHMRSGQGAITSSTSASQIPQILRSNWSGQDGFYGNAQSEEEEDIRKSLAHLELLRRSSYSAVNSNSPSVAGTFMTDATNAFLVMSALGNPATDQVRLTTSTLSDPKIIEAAMLEGNTTNLQRRLALADAASEFYSTTEPAQQQNEFRRALEQPMLGVPLRTLVDFKVPQDEVDGRTEITFEVNKEALRGQLQATLGGGVGPGQVDAYTRQVTNRIAPVLLQINESIRANAHVEALGLPTLDDTSVDYLNMADQLGWVDYLIGRQ